MSKYQDPTTVITVIVSVSIIALVLVFTAVQPYFEAKAFNDCTGGHASYFTAAFTELRVQECQSTGAAE